MTMTVVTRSVSSQFKALLFLLTSLKAAASKTPVKGQMSGKQAGLSNTDTKHSTDPANDPEKSKKSEGAPETAKLQGTVDPGRKLG